MATQAEIRPGSWIRTMIAVVVLCPAALAFAQPEADPGDWAKAPRAFRLAAAENVIGQGAKPGFDLDIFDEAGGGAFAPESTDVRFELPEGNPAAALAAINRSAELPSEGAADNPKTPAKPFGWQQLRFDLCYLARKPAHLDARERRIGLAVAGTTGLLYVFRKDLQEAWHRNSSSSRSDFLSSARVMGEAGFAPTVALGAYLASFFTHNDRERETAQLVLESMALSGLAANIGQFVLATERPEDGDAVNFFRSGGHGVSGDVALAASIIPPLRRQYLRVKPADRTGTKVLKHGLSALLYSGMVFTALQRIDADKHWAPDVFLGMVTGLGVGGTLGQAHDEAEQQRSRIVVGLVPGGAAMMWTWNLDPR